MGKFVRQKIVWREKPPPFTPIDRSDPLGRHIVAAYLFDNESRLYDYSGNNHHSTSLTGTGNPTLVSQGIGGPGLRFDGNMEFVIAQHSDFEIDGSVDGVAIAFGVTKKTTGNSGEIIEKQSGGNNLWQVRWQTGLPTIFVRQNSNTESAAVNALSVDEYRNYVARIDPAGTQVSMVGDGIPDGSPTSYGASGDFVNVAADVIIGGGTAGGFDGILHYLYVFRDHFEVREAYMLHEFPYRVFKSRERRIWIPTAGQSASGGATLAAATASGNAEAQKSASGGATLGAVTASGNADVNKSASGGATLAAATASGNASIAGGESASGAATLGAATASGNADVQKSASGNPTLAAAVAAGTAEVGNVGRNVVDTLTVFSGSSGDDRFDGKSYNRHWFNTYQQRTDFVLPWKEHDPELTFGHHYVGKDITNPIWPTKNGTEQTETRLEGRTSIYWDDAGKLLHVVSFHATSGQSQYWRYSYNDGTDQYTRDVNAELIPGIDRGPTGMTCGLFVMPNGDLWVAAQSSTAGLHVNRRTSGVGGTWGTVCTLAAGALEGCAAAAMFQDAGGADNVSVFSTENDAATGAVFRHFFIDSDGGDGDVLTPANWTEETIPSTIFDSLESDNHLDVVMAPDNTLLWLIKTGESEGGADVGETLIGILKRVQNGTLTDHEVYALTATAANNRTRGSIGIDGNGLVYVFTNQEPTTDEKAYVTTSPYDDLNTWSTEVEVFSSTGRTFSDTTTYQPDFKATPESGFVVLAEMDINGDGVGNEVWYNILEVDMQASGSPSIPALSASGTAAVERSASGGATLGAATASGNAERSVRASDGSPSLPSLSASGTSAIERSASGGATVPAASASGTASVGGAHTASGAATLAPATASGNAAVEKSASGGASLAALVASGAANRIAVASDGSPALTAIFASGAAQRNVSASGSASLAAATASGNASTGGLLTTASGAASLASIVASGAATAHRASSGSPLLPSVVASGAASLGRSSSGAATIPVLTASGTALVGGVTVVSPFEGTGYIIDLTFEGRQIDLSLVGRVL